MITYPRWINTDDLFNLREVAPNLYIGAEGAAAARPAGYAWHTIVDLYGPGSEFDTLRDPGYKAARHVIHLPFTDGNKFPDGALDTIVPALTAGMRRAPTLVHCQAGLSRSASAAYAVLRCEGLSHERALRRVLVMQHAHRFPREETLASARRWFQERRARAGLAPRGYDSATAV